MDRNEIGFGRFRLDLSQRKLVLDGGEIRLGNRALDILCVLASAAGEVVSKDELMTQVWPGLVVEENNIQVHVSALRKALDAEKGGQTYVVTVPGRGYRLVGLQPWPVTRIDNVGTRPSLPLPDKPSIAVLPFQNMSDDPQQDYFAEGMAEEIITALSRCSWLFVIARNSSFTYKGNAVDIRQVGRELGVRYVLEGSVRRGGDSLRFTGQLIDANSGAHIWADRFEGKLGDVFALQDTFTEAVVAAIEPTLQLAEIERSKKKSTINLDAYDLLLRAQQLEYQFTEKSLAAALDHLKQALVVDPSYAPAMALAAYCHGVRTSFGWTQTPEADAEAGLHLAWRAVQVSKDDANVLWMAAHAVFYLQTDPQRAKELAYRSLELNPNSAIALAQTGRIETALGNSAKALELLLRADRLTPRDPRGWFIAACLGFAYYKERRYDESVAAAKKALNQNPHYTWPFRILVVSLIGKGLQSEARQVARELLTIEPQLTLTKLRARLTFREESDWNDYAGALRLAGIPE